MVLGMHFLYMKPLLLVIGSKFSQLLFSNGFCSLYEGVISFTYCIQWEYLKYEKGVSTTYDLVGFQKPNLNSVFK